MKLESSGATSYRQLFGVSGFSRLAVGTVLARTAVQLWQVALVLFVLQRYHSPVLAGVASFLSIAPGLAVSPVAGALLDRHGRLRLILLDYGIAASALVLVFALERGAVLSPALLLPIVALSSLTGPLSASGTRTLFPLIVPRGLWDRANAIDSGSQALATVVGPALAGFLVAWVGGPGAFLATAIVYGLAALVIVGLDDPHTERTTYDPLLRASWNALVYVVRNATLRGIMITMFVGNIGYGVLTVALPVLIFTRFHWGADAVGSLWAVAGLATVASGIFVGRIRTEGRERAMVAYGIGLAAIGCALLAVSGSALILVLGMLTVGISSAPVDIGLFSLRQRRTDPRWFGRAFAVSMSLNFAGAPIGAALGGPIIAHSVTLAIALAAVVTIGSCAVTFGVIPRHEDRT